MLLISQRFAFRQCHPWIVSRLVPWLRGGYHGGESWSHAGIRLPCHGWVDGWMGRVLVETIAPRAMHL